MPVALGIGRILIVGQVPTAPLYLLLQSFLKRLGFAVQFTDYLLQRLRVRRRLTPPIEAECVGLDGYAVQFYSLQQRIETDRDSAFLEGIADQENIGCNTVAGQSFGNVGCIEEIGFAVIDSSGNRITERRLVDDTIWRHDAFCRRLHLGIHHRQGIRAELGKGLGA